jgi:hypothetical protein
MATRLPSAGQVIGGIPADPSESMKRVLVPTPGVTAPGLSDRLYGFFLAFLYEWAYIKPARVCRSPVSLIPVHFEKILTHCPIRPW